MDSLLLFRRILIAIVLNTDSEIGSLPEWILLPSSLKNI